MPKWNEYTEKELPVDNDILMIEDSENNLSKILKLKKLADWIVGKVKKCIPDLENHTAVSDGDYIILGQGTDARKITVAALRTALGIDALSTSLKIKEYDPVDFNFNSFCTILEFQCFRIGRLVFLNFDIFIKAGTTILVNTLYAFNNKTIPSELIPKRNAMLQGYCCDSTFGNATQISAYLNRNNGCIQYSTPVSKSYFVVQGFWLLDS